MSKYHQLTEQERYAITALKVAGHNQAQISRKLGRARSTISREFARNRTPHDGFYRAEKAQSFAAARRRRSRRGSRYSWEHWARVEFLLRKKLSPEQISGLLARNNEFCISHETIYRRVLADKEAGGTLYTHLRIMPKLRRKRYNSQDSRGVLRGKRHISERPPEVQTRRSLGHWEGDTVIGKDKFACILTLVERRSGFVVIKKLTARTADQACLATAKTIAANPNRFRTITFDNGTEFHNYQDLERSFAVTCYFATPYHSWERGTNENTNGLIRQYIPKGSCMRKLTQEQCNQIAYELNHRPRKRHGFRTPADFYPS